MKLKHCYDIVVVGGGTAGWSAAAVLSTNKDYNVTVIDPSCIPTIGVGESTIPQLNNTHERMGFDVFKDNMWLDEVDGTFKLSIYFKDFFKKGCNWINPFLMPSNVDCMDTQMVQDTIMGNVNLSAYRDQVSYVTDNYILSNMQARGFIEPHPNEPITRASYAAYHFNAGLYGQLLKRESLKRSNTSTIDSPVKHIVGQDKIEKIILENGQEITADLFVDCTGFNALLLNHLNSPWDDSYKKRLLVDTAVAVQLPYVNKYKQQRNFTTCTALENGWVWNVPLQSRIGTGYIFSSKHISTDEASNRFIRYLVDTHGYNPNDITPREVPFNTGLRRESWKSNVVGVGLSSFFLEPIESTAIGQLDIQLGDILDLLEATHIPWSKKISRFNEKTNNAIDGIADYIEAHYSLSKRRDSQFWKDVTSKPLNTVLNQLLFQFTNDTVKFDNKFIINKYRGNSMFTDMAYMFLFLGYDIGPNTVSLQRQMTA